MDGLNQALIDAVKAAGGSAAVGRKMFPEKAPEAAQRALLDCLNEDRPAKLSPEQVLLVLRLARAKGHHGAIAFILTDLGYAPTTPIDPKDEASELTRQAGELLRGLESVTSRLERLQPQLRAVA